MPVDHSNVVEITEDIKLIMKYPSLSDMTNFDMEGQVSSIFDMIKSCVHEVHEGENVYRKIDMSDNDLEDFIDSMSTDNFDNLNNFFETMPKLIHVIEVTNPVTKKKSEIPIEGLQSFFD